MHVEPVGELPVRRCAGGELRIRLGRDLLLDPQQQGGMVARDAQRFARTAQHFLTGSERSEALQLRLGRITAPGSAELVAQRGELPAIDLDALGGDHVIGDEPVAREGQRAERQGVTQRFEYRPVQRAPSLEPAGA